MKYSFRNDYSEGCHPRILEALTASNLTQSEGYGEDQFCEAARKQIKDLCRNEKLDIHFFAGGTITNLTTIAHALRPYESVIANGSGHIATHETGAIEATGHKINTIENATGKVTIDDIIPVLEEHHFEHMVHPKLVYISNTTEVGTVYTKAELENLYKFCKSHNLFLFIDGARLGSALTSHKNDLTLKDISSLCDAFYIGGTKNGFLLGEALVINNPDFSKHFRFQMKQRGGLMAKGRILGVQFECMLKDNLYFDLAQKTNLMALNFAKKLEDKGVKFLQEVESNQIFPIFSDKLLAKLREEFEFYDWCRISDDSMAVRLITSWATQTEQIDKFCKMI